MKKLMMVVAGALALSAFAQGPMRGPGRGPMGGPMGSMQSIDPVVRFALSDKAAEAIGLSEEQSAKLKALADDREQIKTLQAKVRECANRQAELLKAEKLDEAAIMAALDESFAARKEVAKLQTKKLIAIRSILTDEQIAKAREAMRSMRGNRRGNKANRANKPKKAKAGGEQE